MRKIEALSILRPENSSEKALKAAYRKAAIFFHPDKASGNLEMMKLVNAAYEVLKGEFWTPYEQRAANRETPLTEQLQKVWDEISHFEGIKAEIIGSWLWVGGNTRAYKEQLKKIGFKWAPKKKLWYFHADKGYRRYSKKESSIDDIRSRYGSTDLRSKKKRAIA